MTGPDPPDPPAGGPEQATGQTPSHSDAATRVAPASPPGPIERLANTVCVYARANQLQAVRPYLHPDHGGVVLAGSRALSAAKLLRAEEYPGPLLIDPALYERHVASAANLFPLPQDELRPGTLADALDEQRAVGATAALTPTAYIGGPEALTVLMAAAAAVAELDRDDVLFAVPLDIQFLLSVPVERLVRVLTSARHPVALIGGDPPGLGGRTQSVLDRLRQLALRLPAVVLLRTGLAGLDAVAHGALAAAVGASQSTRYIVDPTADRRFRPSQDRSPRVLIPELLAWWRGSDWASLFGARPRIAWRCDCAVCQGQRPTRFQRSNQRAEALAHDVASWTEWTADIFEQPTLGHRAEYWRNLCASGVREHTFIQARLQRREPLVPTAPVRWWATQPSWS